MRAEFRIVSRIARGEDFYEGVRAVIVDKDNSPRWRPAGLAQVDGAQIERHFAPRARHTVPFWRRFTETIPVLQPRCRHCCSGDRPSRPRRTRCLGP